MIPAPNRAIAYADAACGSARRYDWTSNATRLAARIHVRQRQLDGAQVRLDRGHELQLQLLRQVRVEQRGGAARR